jgi:ring-1,2-phenylacetyl-CoA epoxidase subunit PaaD
MATLAINPSVKDIWRWLEDVPDPEIPVVSVVELGIVRDVARDGDAIVVTITPTYSGCPATAVIAIDIEQAIRRRGVDDVRIETQLSPAWTTDWITEAACEKLKAYGIAPPEKGAACAGALRAGTTIHCPLCGSSNTECISQFGSTPCKAHYRCKDCLEPFDYFKSF